MAKNTTSGMITTINASYKVVNGVTYFKLVSEFEGDYTKNCGLLGNEIDENFYFLRGYDIKSVEYDDTTDILTITRVDEDYEPIEVNMGKIIAKDRPVFDFDPKTGVLTIAYDDGTEEEIGGFMVEGTEDIKIGTDSTLKGRGTMYNPIGLSPIERTGTYAPANELVDLSDISLTEEYAMPSGHGKGYRIVTKEKFTNFGFLYPYSAVERIQAQLEQENSGWRIPSKADWDELLNAMECPEYRNHSSYTANYLGKDAGVALKSAELYEEGNVNSGMWEEADPAKIRPIYSGIEQTAADVVGQDTVGFTALPVGFGDNRQNFTTEPKIQGFRETTAFWSNTTDELSGEIYGKIFSYLSSAVYQSPFDDDSLLSIRLVKDYDVTNPDFFVDEYEKICGFYYPTVIISVDNEDCKYTKVWTAINFYGDPDNLGGVPNSEWENVDDIESGTKTVYFICESDGKGGWYKKQMSEGDSVVILNKDGEENYHEWRIIHGELVDTLDQMYDDFGGELGRIKEQINTISSTTMEFSASVVTEVERIDNTISGISTAVTELSAATTSEIERLDAKIDDLASATTTEIGRVEDKVDELSGSVETEVERLDGKVSELSGSVESEIERLDGEIAPLAEAITAISGATDEMRNAISGFTEAISAETTNRVANDVTPGTYDFSQEGTEIPTNGESVGNVILDVTDDFFHFGNIIDE